MNQKMFPRRQFIKMGLSAGAGALILPSFLSRGISSAFAKDANEDPHFFLMITLPSPSGVDGSYLWDARAAEMTAAGLIQNYRKNGVTSPWLGTNGVSTLATEIVQPLSPFKSDFTVINGTLMDIGFDGHDQNINYLFTGDPFGGECFIPHLNATPANRKALDAIQRGAFTAAQTNGEETVPLNPSAAQALIASLAKVPPLDPSSKLFQFLSSRFVANSVGSGGFSVSSANMNTALSSSASLAQIFAKIKTSGLDTDAGFVELANQAFRTGVAKSAVLVLDPGKNIFDAHDPVSAAALPKTYADLVTALVSVLTTMKSTPFDSSHSMLDVTTFMFSSEFSRTLRQNGKKIDQTGTDHNPLTNCVLVGGKGIKGGQVLGSSDFNTPSEILSGAHLSLDKARLKSMGRPYDFVKGISRTDLPADYHAADYLGFNSIVNTLYQMFNVPQNHWRLTERNGVVAPVLTHLL